jgi:16S rRNA processing protein RimM
VAGREQAEALAGTVLFAPPLDEAGVIWAHEVIGCVVIDAEGIERGTVTALQDNPASDLLVLDTGALVPLVFVVDGPRDGQVHVAVPPGSSTCRCVLEGSVRCTVGEDVGAVLRHRR